MRGSAQTHATHCCILHGCKYGDDDCPVVKGRLTQVYTCEACSYDGINSVNEVFEVLNGKLKTCPHCGHVLE